MRQKSILFGFFVLAGLSATGLFLSGTQSVDAQPLCALHRGFVSPGAIANLDGEASITGNGGDFQVYAVPDNRWLVLTDVEAITLEPGSNEYQPWAQLVEKTPQGAEMVKRNEHFFRASFPVGGAVEGTPVIPYHSSVGLAFEPGSKVIIKNISSGDIKVSYTLTGFLVP